jgi:hypothetical protein
MQKRLPPISRRQPLHVQRGREVNRHQVLQRLGLRRTRPGSKTSRQPASHLERLLALGLLLLLLQPGTETLLNVRLEYAEHGFVSLHRHLERG